MNRYARFAILLPCLALLLACEAQPARPANVKWTEPTLDNFKNAQGVVVMVVITNGTQKCDGMVNSLLSNEVLEKTLERCCAMKVDGTKKDDPVVKEIEKHYEIKSYPAFAFFSHRRIPKGMLQGTGLAAAEIQGQIANARN